MLSISTAWNYKEDQDWSAWLDEIKSFGIPAVELGYKMTHKQVNSLLPFLPKKNIKVNSIHNFCPIPDDEPSPRHASNYYRLSALDKHERSQAVKWTKKTIDLAVQVGAGVVVIHAGTVELENDPSKIMFQLYKDGKKSSPEFVQARNQVIEMRQKVKKPYIDGLLESLKEVVDYGYKKNIKIGLETRYYPIEIPNYEEVGFFLNIFRKGGMGYWHDVGHAEVNERLGVSIHKKFLEDYKDDLIGMHIHGVRELRDHVAPFEGDFDFAPVFPYLKKGVLRVIESHAYATAEQIKKAVERLQV